MEGYDVVCCWREGGLLIATPLSSQLCMNMKEKKNLIGI